MVPQPHNVGVVIPSREKLPQTQAPVSRAVPLAKDEANFLEVSHALVFDAESTCAAAGITGAWPKNHQGSVIKNGHPIRFVTGENHWFWKLYKDWEVETFRVFQHFVPGKVVLDIGAWIGPTALWAAGDAEAVVCLEPTQKAFLNFAGTELQIRSSASALLL